MLNHKLIPKDIEIERFMSHVQKQDDGCWIWTSYKIRNGYGVFAQKGYSYLAHRVSYSHFSKVIDSGMLIDHICRNKSCINPEHLREVTRRQNTLENSSGHPFVNSSKTHCIKGHEFSEDNIYWAKNGNRHCKTCKTKHNKNRYSSKAEIAHLKQLLKTAVPWVEERFLRDSLIPTSEPAIWLSNVKEILG